MHKLTAIGRIIEGMKPGEKIYLNAIDFSTGEVEQLREYVKMRVLLPAREEVEKSYNDIESVMNGITILPQMTYIKQ